ncbi:peptidase S8/S53 domain-containing protein [Xylaria arbuscula]|nr:peptidase S8/S53 domain-containing protein [Xylaria arbuscula]
MENFAMLLKNYRKPGCEESKVAIIDDGVDAAHGSLSRNIADGKSFSKGHGGLYSSYYKSTRGHGTIMATLIRKVCPDARLYVAKLDEKRTDNGLEITADSAVEAIRWAISRKVHIISMSWTINETTRNKDAINELKSAIYDAEKLGILLFCSVSDQGVKKDVAFPASLNNVVFRIGAATVYGDTWKWVGTDEADVDFILPGTRLRVDTRDPVAKSVKPCSKARWRQRSRQALPP